MKPANGQLESNHIIVTNSKDVGRLFQKSNFGKINSKNILQLSLIESAYLIEEKKLNVYLHDEKISFNEIITYASDFDHLFEEKYLVFRDLRKRGMQVQLSTDSDFTFYYEKYDDELKQKTSQYIITISERDIPSLFQLYKLAKNQLKNNNAILLGLVDEEGDITYYSLEIIDLHGENKHHRYEQINGIMLSNRVIVFGKNICEQLHKQEFFGKPFDEGLQLSLVEAFYLHKKGILSCSIPSSSEPLSKNAFIDEILKHQRDILLRYRVFSDLKQKGLIVKTGFKFGTHFRAYKKSPFHSHAEYLVHAIEISYQTQWPEISRAVRLAHAVNKILLFGLIFENEKTPIYMSITRIRP
jgi:tRNA-intron endonuclease